MLWHCDTIHIACRHGYERELLTLLEQLVRDMDRKIERAKERAEKEKGARPLMPDDKIRLDALKKRQKGMHLLCGVLHVHVVHPDCHRRHGIVCDDGRTGQRGRQHGGGHRC